MKNRILLAIAALLIVLLVVVRYLFSEKMELFKKDVALYERQQLESFRREKENRIALLAKSDLKISQIFEKQFDESKAIIERDTSFTFLYLHGSVTYKFVSVRYIDCLNNKCIIDVRNDVNGKQISAKEKELEHKYGDVFTTWYPKLKDERLVVKASNASDCDSIFPGLYEISFNENIWNDFEKFMIVYIGETKESKIQNQRAESQYSGHVASTKGQLRSAVIPFFEEQLSSKRSQIISTQSETKTYNSPTLGSITYSVDRTSFDNSVFNEVADEAFEEQWKYNSLNTGAMPYAYCFGSSNYCDYYGCSKITVRTGGSDVLVTIKDRSGDVVRHGYINAGRTFSFNLPDGTYQVFFYSGTGWNPSKFMKNTSCGVLKGGFVSDEDVTKDDYISLYNQQMTYELIMQHNGNLSTQPSSKGEAF